MYNETETKKNKVEISDSLKSLVDDWLCTHEQSSVLCVLKNKLDSTLVAVNGRDTIYLFGGNYQSIMYSPKLTFSIIENGHLHIDDINARHNNVGNGSILLYALLYYANLNGIKKITGDLSPIDNDHRARLEHYYNKFGFTISPNAIYLEVKNELF